MDSEVRVRARVSLVQIQRNFKAISRLAPQSQIIPMVKADAYGHGALAVARALAHEPRLDAFGVATLDEGRELREARLSQSILIFSGTAHWDQKKGQFCERFGLTPVISSLADLEAFLRHGWQRRIRYELKFNTGMNRLGIEVSDLSSCLDLIQKLKVSERPQGVLSHLATADQPQHPLTRIQVERFREITQAFGNRLARPKFHLQNSAAIWNASALGIRNEFLCVRPGLSLYGITPSLHAPARGVLPALRLEARLLQVKRLKKGERVGYSGTYRVRAASERVGTLGIGYADGLHRLLSNQSNFVGLISMDLTGIRLRPSQKEGDWISVTGKLSRDLWKSARCAGTVPYELLTSISSRVRRDYEST
jgi:alanine racemase